jgi:hypothetical protein
VSTRYTKRGRPPVDSDLVRFRAERRILDAIDTFAEDQNPPLSRAKAVRLLIAEQLTALGLLAQSDNPDDALPEMTERQMIANAGEVRTNAADAADVAMSGMDATKEQKASRRRELTDEPAMAGKARDKGKPEK